MPFFFRLPQVSRFKFVGIVLVMAAVSMSAFGQVENIVLQPGKPIERELKSGESHTYRLALTSGQYFSAAIDQRGIDVVVVLSSPESKKLLDVDSPNGRTGPESIRFISDTAGEYLIEVRSEEKDAPAGRYEIKLVELRTAEDVDRFNLEGRRLGDEGIRLHNLATRSSGEERRTRLDAARIQFELSLSQFRAAKNARGEIEMLSRIGLSYLTLGNRQKGLEYQEESLACEKKLGDKKRIATATGNLGLNYKTAGLFERAKALIEQAYMLFSDLDLHADMSLSSLNLGDLYDSVGEYKTALKYYEVSLNHANKSSEPRRIMRSYHKLGVIYDRLGDTSRALESQKRASELYLASGDEGGVASMSVNTASTYATIGNLDQAEEYYLSALTLFEKEKVLGLSGVGMSLLGLGEVSLERGNYDQALVYFDRAIEIFRKLKLNASIAETLQMIGRIEFRRGNLELSLTKLKEAAAIHDSLRQKTGLAETLIDMAKVYRSTGDPESSLESAQRASIIAKQAGLLESLWRSKLAEGVIYLSKNQLGNAKTAINEAIDIVETLRSNVPDSGQSSQLFFATATTPYREMVKLEIMNHNVKNAWLFAERSKSRGLLDALQHGKAEINSSMTEKERELEQLFKIQLVSLNSQIKLTREKENAALDMISELEKELQKKRLEYEDFRVQLFARHPRLQAQRAEMKPISFDETAVLLKDERSVLAEYVITDDKAFVSVITKNTSNKVSLKTLTIDVNESDLAKQIEAYRAKLAAGDLDFQQHSRNLYHLLLKPAEAQLAGKTNIIIVPDGPLWDLPFQALQDEKGKYLIEKTAISYAPSLTALREMKKRAKSRSPSPDAELLAFGNPIVGRSTAERVQRVFMSEKLEPIPEAERLVNSLARMYGPMRSKVFTGANAREETAKTEAPKYRIVQFATHGILNNVSPMYSHLVLAQNEKNPNEDGLLEAWEMKDLDLKADMVILSACDTARGKISNGEGVIGMTWAAFIAGAPTTVASQWKVESSSTTELMLEFHRQLLAKPRVSKSEAVRRASLKLMKMPQYKHPSYWAGFVMIGDGS